MPHFTSTGEVLLLQSCCESLESFAVDYTSHSILIYLALETESVEETESWVFYAPNTNIYIYTHGYVLQYKSQRKVTFWFHLNRAGFVLQENISADSRAKNSVFTCTMFSTLRFTGNFFLVLWPAFIHVLCRSFNVRNYLDLYIL